MFLSKIEIKNFRSIKSLIIDTDPKCQIFVGINESGKSNILKAISLLNSDDFSNDDIRFEGKQEEPVEEAFINYYFKCSEIEIRDMLGFIEESLIANNIFPPSFIDDIRSQWSILAEYITDFNVGYCFYDLKNKSRGIIVNSINEITKKSLIFKNPGDFQYIDSLEDIVSTTITQFIRGNLPEIVYWKYDEKHLLPNTINLLQFQQNPSICLPLKSMFYLTGYKDIQKVITEARNGRRNALENILDKVSVNSTNYLNEVWRDYGNIKFHLSLDGENLNIHIQDEENKYDCDQRSDGFKRFIAFLLSLSAKVKHGEIEESIIIVDEPDINLHISGQRYLTEELIKMSSKNLVFYSTHSIFMIDSKKPDRHFIVKKLKEETVVKRVEKSNITDDEVIYRALGYSTFETLKENNLIFEGWSDQEVLKMVLSSNDSRIPDQIRNFGLTFSTGVSNITPIAKILELANRNYFVISDSDDIAKRSKKDYIDQDRCLGPWYMYGDFIQNIFTLEDFVKHSSFKNSIENSRQNTPQLTKEFDYNEFSKIQFKRVDYIKDWVKECTNDSKKIKEIMMEIKIDLYSNLSISDLEEQYFDFIISLNEKIKE
ncbi:DNA replication and repair protein RecF [Methanimicrococcus hongohii]|uniref:DNA replication and repair protein RecF n=1 Tax=Methanimicrococcus hongohii TaxID=3028295 RepID=A0AA96V0T8_9EURY|nr:AAA family ATPase [Methanimicrococcus sp. Hf6]WNY23175.1 DNA replication and repair protein RecF [Methanimicrococcus sp. Hf6]